MLEETQLELPAPWGECSRIVGEEVWKKVDIIVKQPTLYIELSHNQVIYDVIKYPSERGKFTLKFSLLNRVEQSKKEYQVTFRLLGNEYMEVMELLDDSNEKIDFTQTNIFTWEDSIESFIWHVVSTKYWPHLSWGKEVQSQEFKSYPLSRDINLLFLPLESDFNYTQWILCYLINGTRYRVFTSYTIQDKRDVSGDVSVKAIIEEISIPHKASWNLYIPFDLVKPVLESIITDPNINTALRQRMDEVM